MRSVPPAWCCKPWMLEVRFPGQIGTRRVHRATRAKAAAAHTDLDFYADVVHRVCGVVATAVHCWRA